MNDITSPREPKLYVVVRQDLTHGQQLAQTGHAAAEYARRHPERVESAPVICVLGVADRFELDSAYSSALARSWIFDLHTPFMFFEPDFGDIGEYSAFAIVSTGEEFSHLRLAGGPHKLPFYRRVYRSLNKRFVR